MPQPLYIGGEQDAPPPPGRPWHKGLWFDRFFRYQQEDYSSHEKDKQRAITAVAGITGDTDQLHAFAERQVRLVDQLNGQYRCFRLDWHFVTGMGNEHPVENGFLWHPTLATPYLQGASVKGLLRSWLEQEGADPALLHQWFGSDAKNPGERQREAQAGELIFHDAIPIEQAEVGGDIMTPHMGKWYEKGGEGCPEDQADTLPADWHSPVPVPFLVTKKTTLLFAISPRTQAMVPQMDQVMAQLELALEWLGAGAKTATGYGAMSRDPRKEEQLMEQLQAQQEKAQNRKWEASLTSEKLKLHHLRKRLEKDIHNDIRNEAGGECKSQLNQLVQAVEKESWSVEDLKALEELAGEILKRHGPPPNKKGKGRELMNRIKALRGQV